MTSERAAGESQLAPGSRLPSPFPVEPGDSSFAESEDVRCSARTTESKNGSDTAHDAAEGSRRPSIPDAKGAGVTAGPETPKWVSAPGRREHNALAFLRRRWSADHVVTERGYWLRFGHRLEWKRRPELLGQLADLCQ